MISIRKEGLRLWRLGIRLFLAKCIEFKSVMLAIFLKLLKIVSLIMRFRVRFWKLKRKLL